MNEIRMMQERDMVKSKSNGTETNVLDASYNAEGYTELCARPGNALSFDARRPTKCDNW
jgi:hypothetical protein